MLARQMTAALAAALPGRDIHVVADAAYAGRELRRLPASITWTTRQRKDAALYELPGPRTGKPGRPRIKGKRLPSLDVLTGMAAFARDDLRAHCISAALPGVGVLPADGGKLDWPGVR